MGYIDNKANMLQLKFQLSTYVSDYYKEKEFFTKMTNYLHQHIYSELSSLFLDIKAMEQVIQQFSSYVLV